MTKTSQAKTRNQIIGDLIQGILGWIVIVGIVNALLS